MIQPVVHLGVWKAISEFLLKAHASGLGHDAVIEIMIALLAIMLTVLGLMIAVFGFFGYTAIRDEAVRNAVLKAEGVAQEAASKFLKGQSSGIEAAAYAEAQKEIAPRRWIEQLERAATTDIADSSPKSTPSPQKKRRATRDSNLTRDNDDDTRTNKHR